MPGNGKVAEPGLHTVMPGQRRDQDVARLRLPPRVDDGAAAAADDLPVPHPRLGIDRLAHRAEQAQRRQIAAGRVLFAPAHERADGGGRGVEDGHPVPLDDAPEAILVRPVGRALVHDHGGAVGQRSVDDVGVSGHPPDVGRAPVRVVLAEVEDHGVGGRDAREVPAGRVHDALGLAGGPRRVEEVQHVLGSPSAPACRTPALP